MADGYNGLRRIASPDSSLYDPKAITDAERRAQEIERIARENETEFYKGLRGGMQGLESAYHGVGSMKDALLGDEEGALRSAERAQKISKNAAKLGPSVNDLSQVEDLQSAGSYASGMLGQALPSILQSMIGAGMGALTSGPVGAVAGLGAGGVRGVGEKLALKAIKKIGENYTKKAIRRGIAAGTYGSSLFQEAGSMQQSILDPANRAAWEQVQRGKRVQDARNGVHGYVYKYIDGDSFWFQPEDGSSPYQIRLPHINTADTGQEGKNVATERFRSLTNGRRLSHAPANGVDTFGRQITDVYTDGSTESVGRQMLSSGAATVHSAYPGQQDLFKQERIGRSAEGAIPNYVNRYAQKLTPEQIAQRNKLGDIPEAAVGITGRPMSMREQTLVNLLGAGVAAIPDSVLPYHIASRFGLAKEAKKLVQNELKQAGGVKGILGNTASRVLKEAGRGMPIEGATEGLQTFIERTTNKFIDQNKEVLGEEGINEILNATMAGAIGGLWGGIGGVMPNANEVAPQQVTPKATPTQEESSYDVRQSGMPPETQPGSSGIPGAYQENMNPEETQTRAFDREFLTKPTNTKNPNPRPYVAMTREALVQTGSDPEAVAQENSLEKAVKNADGDYKIVSLRNMVEAQAAKEHPGDVQAQQEYVRTYAQQKYEEDSGMRLRQRLDANSKEADRIAGVIRDTERVFNDPDVAPDASPEMRSAARDYLVKLKEARKLINGRLEKDAAKLESLADRSSLYSETNPAAYLDHFQVAEKQNVTPDTTEFKLSEQQLKSVVRSVSAKYKLTPSQIRVGNKSVNLRNLVSIVAGQTFATRQESKGIARDVGDQLLLGLTLLQEKGVLELPRTKPGQKSQMAIRDKLIQRLGPNTVLYQKGKSTVTVEQALRSVPEEKLQSYTDTQYQERVIQEKRQYMTGQQLATEDTVERGTAAVGSSREFNAPPQEEELGKEAERAPELMRKVTQTKSGPTLPINRREGPEILRSPMDREYTNDERRAIAKQRAVTIGRAISEARKDNSVRTAHAMVQKFLGKNALEELRGQPQGVVRMKALRLLKQIQNKALEDSTKPDSAFLVEQKWAAKSKVIAKRRAAAKQRAAALGQAINKANKAYMSGAVEPAPTAQLIAEGDPESLVREHAIANSWAENIGLDMEVEVVSVKNLEEMYKRSPNPENLKRSVESGAQYGLMQLAGKKLYIFVHPRLKDNAARIETIGHEIGHAVQHRLYENADIATKEAIFESFNEFLVKSKGATVGEIIKMKKAAATLRARFRVDSRTLDALSPEQQTYILSFKEWFADHTSRWLTTNKKPLGVVEAFFSRVATTLKHLFRLLRGEGYTADENVSQFLESIWSSNRGVDPVVELVNELAKNGEKGYHDKLAAAMMHPGVGNYQAAVRLGMHEFLKKPELTVLGRALYTRAMRNKVRSLLQEDGRLGALAEQRRNPEAQLGFAYEYWAAGRLKLGPKTAGVFSKLAAIVKRFFGFPDNVAQAERVLQAMAQGRVTQRQLAETNELFATPERLSETAVQRATSAVLNLADPITRSGRALFLTADGQLRAMKNPWVTKLADMFSAEAGSQGNKDTYFEDMRRNRTKYLNQVLGIFRDKDEAFGQAFVAAMSEGKLSKDKEIAAAQRKVSQMFHNMREYLTGAGVDLGDRGELYWPQIYDLEYLSSHNQDLIDLLLQHSSDEFLGGSVKFDPEEGKKVFTPGTEKLSPGQRESAAARIVQALYDDKGSGDGELHNIKPGQRPFMSAYDLRLMDKEMTGIPQEKLAPFLSKDPGSVLQTYVTSAVKRAEFTRRLGRDGEKLTQIINRAKQYGLTAGEKKIVDNYVHAMLGTLSADKISPKTRKAMGAMMVFQNMRVLALAAFSSLSDPLGIYMRSGDMQTALRAYKAGISSWLSDHRDEPDQLHKLGEAIGIVNTDLTNEALNWEYGGVFLGGTASKLNNWLFKWNGLQDLTKITRLMALDAGKAFLIDHAMNPGKDSARYLDQLNLTAEDVKADMVDGKLEGKSEAVQKALVRFVDEAILRPNAAQRPVWGSDPRFMLVFHLKQFTYSFYNTILKRVYTEYADHGKMAPVMRLMTYIPIMIAADLIRDALKDIGDDQDADRKDEWTLDDYIWEGTQRAGLLGVGQFAVDAMDASEHGKPFPLPFAGPTAEWGYSMFQASKNGTMDEWVTKQYPGQSLINPMMESLF